MKNFVVGFLLGAVVYAILTYTPSGSLAKAPSIPDHYDDFLMHEYRQLYPEQGIKG